MKLHISRGMRGGAGQIIDCCNVVFVEVIRKSIRGCTCPTVQCGSGTIARSSLNGLLA